MLDDAQYHYIFCVSDKKNAYKVEPILEVEVELAQTETKPK